MSDVITTPNIADPDGFYAKLIALHDGLSDADSAALNARLVLIFANQVGARRVLDQVLEMASKPGA